MIKPGDIVTVAGFYVTVPNPHRRWWQFWKPKMIEDRTQLRKFRLEQ